MGIGKPWVLGLSTGFHNGAACLCHGDEIVVAIQEERLTRWKRSALQRNRRSLAIDYCLTTANIEVNDLDLVVDCNISFSRAEAELPLELVTRNGRIPNVIQIPHHLGHALSAFCTSGFDESEVLIVDGGGCFGWQLPESERARAVVFGDDRCEHLSLYHADNRGITLIEKHLSEMPYLRPLNRERMPSFASLGHMFSSVALQIFGQYLEAGKVMALAPFGRPTISPESFVRYDGRSFEFSDDVPRKFAHSEHWPKRQDEYMDLAASVQRALECSLSSFLSKVRQGRNQNLCYAGGVALNSVANHKIVSRAGFRDVYVIPAAEDNGTAIGAAYYGLMQLSGKMQGRRLTTDALGRTYCATEIDDAIARMPGTEVMASTDVVDECVDRLCKGAIIGWFEGGAEFGPRSLGHRSILCDPRIRDAKDILNRRIKHRESFRPFAPSVLAEHAGQWFALDQPSTLTEFMLDVCPFKPTLPGPDVPAVIHIDGTGRLQTVTRNNGRFYQLIRAFHAKTGVPMIVNTSMNIMGEPIIETPREALWMMLFTGIDYCVIEERMVSKAPSFTSVLDLVPHRTELGERFVSDTPAPDLRTGESDFHRRTRRALNRIDGESSFRSIFLEANPLDRDEIEQLRMVGHLFRHALIDFKT